MAIISGGRINIWNAVKKQFEVVHPETEVARITDFADGIVQKLALTSAMAAITELQKDSWFGKLLKMALTASGVKYSIAENGYVCLGDLFGGLIIQWGISKTKETTPFNISVNSAIVLAVQSNSIKSITAVCVPIELITSSGFYSASLDYNNVSYADRIQWCVICYN